MTELTLNIVIEKCQIDAIIPPVDSIEDVHFILGSERVVQEIPLFTVEPEC